MSATMAQPPTPAAGATQGMPGAPANPIQAKFQVAVKAVQDLMQFAAKLPGANMPTLQEAARKFQEGAVLIAKAMPGQQGASAPGGPPPA